MPNLLVGAVTVRDTLRAGPPAVMSCEDVHPDERDLLPPRRAGRRGLAAAPSGAGTLRLPPLPVPATCGYLTAGEGAIADVEASLETIRADLQTAASEAEAELSEPIAALESSLGGLSTEFDTAKADDDLSADEAAVLLDSLAAVSTSWEALKEAAPDCEL
jgi:hypothetical protein